MICHPLLCTTFVSARVWVLYSTAKPRVEVQKQNLLLIIVDDIGGRGFLSMAAHINMTTDLEYPRKRQERPKVFLCSPRTVYDAGRPVQQRCTFREVLRLREAEFTDIYGSREDLRQSWAEPS